MHAELSTVAIITLANPALLWGAGACAAPILIHLILRPRPRRQPLPSLQFLLATQRSSLRQHRLRHLLLLLLRLLAILLLVAALARPVSRGSWLSAQAREKTAAVFLMDDSVSMTYRFEGLSRFDRAQAWARQLILDETRFPEGSTFMALTGSMPPRDRHWRDDRSDALETVKDLAARFHDRPLSDTIANALDRLAESRLPRRELYVLTDATSHAWSDVADGRWTDAAGIAVFVLDVGDDENINAGLGPPRDFDGVATPLQPLRLSASIRAGDEDVNARIEARLNGSVVARTEPEFVPAHASVEVSILLPALAPGLYAGELRLSAADRLAADDSSFFALQVRQPGRVVVVHDDSVKAEEAVEARRIAALISPPTLPKDRSPFEVTLHAAGRLSDDSALTSADCIILVDVADLPADVSTAIGQIVERGGLLLVVPGPRTSPGSISADWLPADFVEIVSPDPPTRVNLNAEPTTANGGGTGDGADDPGSERPSLTNLLPTDLAGDPISARSIYRFWRTRRRAGGLALATFETGDVAIWGRRIGRGRAIQWAFSLDQDWSDLGVRAAPALVLVQSLVGGVNRDSPRVANILCGRRRTVVADPTQAGAELRIARLADKTRESLETTQRCDDDARLRVGATVAGTFVAEDAARNHQAAFAVNIRDAETNGRRLAPDRIRAFFAPQSAVVVRDHGQLTQPTLSVAGDVALDGNALLLLLVVLLGESLLANRFYHRR